MNKHRVFVMSAGGILTLLALGAILPAAEKIDGIGPTGDIRQVEDGFLFTEGPAWDGKASLYFTDVAGNTIYRIDPTGELETFLEPSNHANGLMFNADGQLFACQMDGQVVSIDPESKKVTPLADMYEGKRFNAPNDLVLDGEGGLYFTDPRFRAPQPLPQGTEAVYYVTKDGKATRLIDDLPAPNGVILSPDQKTLYVIPSVQKEMMAYPVEGPGKLGKGRVFCTVKQPEGSQGSSGGDGCTVDTEGNLYIATALGIQVFNPEGKHLGTIEFPEQPSNVAFGGRDRKTLYVTARTGVYSCEMEAQGLKLPGSDE